MNPPIKPLDAALERLSRRFRFETREHNNSTVIEADDLLLHILEDSSGYTIIFEPLDSAATPVPLSTRSFELEAVLREILGS